VLHKLSPLKSCKLPPLQAQHLIDTLAGCNGPAMAPIELSDRNSWATYAVNISLVGGLRLGAGGDHIHHHDKIVYVVCSGFWHGCYSGRIKVHQGYHTRSIEVCRKTCGEVPTPTTL
jgi:hypothetical protein